MALNAGIAMVEKIENMVVREMKAADDRGERPKDPRGSKEFDQWVEKNKEIGKAVQLVQGSGSSSDKKCSADTKSQIEQFVDSDAYRDWGGSGKGRAFEAQSPTEQVISEKTGKVLSVKAPSIVTVSDLRDQMTTTRLQGVVPLGVQVERLASLMPNYMTMDSAVKYIRETGFTNAAAGRPENIDPASTTGASQSALSTVVKTANVETVDHYVAVPIELYEDAPALVQFLEGRLEDGLDDNEDGMILSGAGAGSNEYLGYLTDTDVPNYNWSSGDTGDNMADAILGAMVAMAVAHYMAEATVLHPTRKAQIVKMKDSHGNYLIPQAHVQKGDIHLWGKPVRETSAIATNKGLVGSFSRSAALWRRLNLRFRMTDSHDGHFVDGMIFILAERRAALTILRPEANREVTFDSAPA